MNLLLAACLLTTTFAQAQTTVNVEKAGTLSEQIGDDMKYQITSLKVTGQLNGTDFVLLRDMAGINLDNVPTDGKLATLDLCEADIVAGGEAYYTDFVTNTDYYTADGEVGKCLFFDCDKLTDVKLPATATVVGDSAFMRCEALAEITLPSAVKRIGSYAFSETSITTFTFPDGTQPAEGMFRNCGKLASVTLPEGCTEIPAKTFSGTALQEISLPEGLTRIGSDAFSSSSLTSLTCPSTLKEIGESAFFMCGSLATIALNDGLETIKGSAFSYCDKLETVNIPNSVTTLEGCFSN